MNVAYGWAFARPVRKIYYNITVTALSVAVALIIGGVDAPRPARGPARHRPPAPSPAVGARRPGVRRLRHRGALRADLGGRGRRLEAGPHRRALERPPRGLGAPARARGTFGSDLRGAVAPLWEQPIRPSLRRCPVKTLRLVIMVLLAGLLGSALVSGNRVRRAPCAGGPRAAHPDPGRDPRRAPPGFRPGRLQVQRRAVPASHHVRLRRPSWSATPPGMPVRIAGRAFLRCGWRPPRPTTRAGPTVPARTAYPLPERRSPSVRAGDSEAVTTYGIGLAKRTPFHVFTLQQPGPGRHRRRRGLPDRRPPGLLLRPGQRSWRTREPFFAPRAPPGVRCRRPAIGCVGPAVRRGRWPASRPTACGCCAPRATGLHRPRHRRRRWPGSGSPAGAAAAGPRSPSPARSCRRCGSSPSVDWVKIYDPSGHTERPAGHTDSIPECLEP